MNFTILKKISWMAVLFFSVSIHAQTNCISGCNENTFVNTSDPNTIEYDNIISVFHSSIIKEVDGNFKVWGQGIGADRSHKYSPTLLLPSEGYNYEGEVLKVAAGSIAGISNTEEFALLTSERLYYWGTRGYLVNQNIRSGNTFNHNFAPSNAIATEGVSGTNPTGLPMGVAPEDVKMMFGSYGTLVIVTCDGKAYVLSFTGGKNGNGFLNNNNPQTWTRVLTAANTPLENVVAVRGTRSALIALTSDGKLYTWGSDTFLGNGTSSSSRAYATEMTLPAGVVPKMIGMTQAGVSLNKQTYYLLGTNGELWSLGDNSQRQLGDFTNTASTTWVQPQKPAAQGGGSFNDVVWISPNEHDGTHAAINVITSDKKLYAWGSNNGSMIGAPTTSSQNPIYMPGGLGSNDAIIAVETGGHTSVAIKQCSQNYGYVGHKINGSMGDGSTGTSNPTTYSFSTAVAIVCGASTTPKVEDVLKICEVELADLSDALIGQVPPDVTLEWYLDEARQFPVSDPSQVNIGEYYAFFIPNNTMACDNPSGALVSVQHYVEGEPGFGQCPQACLESVEEGDEFEWYYANFQRPNGSTVSNSFTQPATTGGYVFDVFKLDNSFNMKINGIPLATQELQFQNGIANLPMNIRFKDGDYYSNQADNIWDIVGTVENPMIRVVIEPTGVIKIYGSKSSGGPLEELELYNGATFNVASWNTSGVNEVEVSQLVEGITEMRGLGYGVNIVECVCYNPANTSQAGLDTKVGITSLNRAGAELDNWPMVRKSGFIALESNSKGFVVNRFSTLELENITSPQEGMMVFDTDEKCLKLYSDGEWRCFVNPTCP